MTWNATRTWALGDLFTSGDANAILRDDVQYNRDTTRFGAVTKDGQVWNATGTLTNYQDFGGASYVQVVSFVKRQADSTLVCRANGSCWVATTTGGVLIGFKVGATDYDGRKFFFNIIANHMTWFSSTAIAGLAAGTYTATLRIKTLGATGAPTTDANDGFTMEVMENSGN